MRSASPAPILTITTAVLIGCASQPPAHAPISSTQGTTLVQTASVIDVRDITVHGGHSSGIGSFVGMVLGGVAGSRIGSGHGSTAASIGGAVAGGMAGHRIEQSGAGKTVTELSLRFDNGDIRTYEIEPGESFRIGDTVRVITSGGVSRVTH